MSRNGDPSVPRIPRDIEEHPDYATLAARIQPDRHLFDYWMEGLNMVIASIPEEFDGIGDVRVALHAGSRLLGIPELAVTFRFTEILITLLWIERLD